jgi:BirA family biotin operon repressor/biotin-[acetyl-CoA-carboxylase] ligase
LKTLYFDTLPSTQLYLKKFLQENQVDNSLAIVSDMQTKGVGSRDNSWNSQDGNLFLSFAIKLEALPTDLKLESASIYFSYILKETLSCFGSKVMLKWPNDLYLDEKKVAGMITNIVSDYLVCGVGVNLKSSDLEFASLDIEVDKKNLIKQYFINIEKKPSWKQVFSKYELDFQTNKKFFTNIKGKKVSLSEAVLQNDGSLNINGERIYSLR